MVSEHGGSINDNNQKQFLGLFGWNDAIVITITMAICEATHPGLCLWITLVTELYDTFYIEDSDMLM